MSAFFKYTQSYDIYGRSIKYHDMAASKMTRLKKQAVWNSNATWVMFRSASIVFEENVFSFRPFSRQWSAPMTKSNSITFYLRNELFENHMNAMQHELSWLEIIVLKKALNLGPATRIVHVVAFEVSP